LKKRFFLVERMEAYFSFVESEEVILNEEKGEENDADFGETKFRFRGNDVQLRVNSARFCSSWGISMNRTRRRSDIFDELKVWTGKMVGVNVRVGEFEYVLAYDLPNFISETVERRVGERRFLTATDPEYSFLHRRMYFPGSVKLCDFDRRNLLDKCAFFVACHLRTDVEVCRRAEKLLDRGVNFDPAIEMNGETKEQHLMDLAIFMSLDVDAFGMADMLSVKDEAKTEDAAEIRRIFKEEWVKLFRRQNCDFYGIVKHILIGRVLETVRLEEEMIEEVDALFLAWAMNRYFS
jgi:hypothetical protein